MADPLDRLAIDKPDAVVLQVLLRAAPDAVIISDQQGRIVIASDHVRETFGTEPEGLLGKPVETLLPQRLRPVHERHRESYYSAPSTRPMGAGLDLVAVRADGTEFPAEISLSHIKTENGLLVMAIIRDVTDRKTSEERIEREHQRLETLIDVSPVGIMVVGTDGGVALVNQEAERLMGFRSRAGDTLRRYETAFVYRRPDGSQYRPEELPLQRALRTGERVSAEKVLFVDGNGESRPTLVDATPILSSTGEVDGAIAVIQDLTPLAEVEKLRDELARLEERERMEMDLHDDVIGTIYGMTLEFEGHVQDLEDESPRASRILGDSIERLQQVITDIREQILDRPGATGARGGFSAQLVEITEAFSRSSGIVAKVHVEEGVALSDGHVSDVLHIVKEALNNGAKHSRASEIVVRLSTIADEIELEVSDDGRGFDVSRVRDGGHGLANMRERARRAGATMSIESAPGTGTRILVRLPPEAR